MAFIDKNGETFELKYLAEQEILDSYVGSSLWAWGDNQYGQLGINNATQKSFPVQTYASGLTWKQLSCGGYHSCSIKTDGMLWCWGRNQYGQLGDSSVVSKSSPVQIGGGIDWMLVSGGYNHTMAIKTDGTLWCWGENSTGAIGDNTITTKSSPVKIGTGTNWKYISGGTGISSAIKTDGTLWMWGYNGSRQLGILSTSNTSSPVQTAVGGTNWKQIACGDLHIAAIKTDGTLWVWGSNAVGQLGLGTTGNTISTPVQLGASNTWKSVSCATTMTMAIKTDGTLWVWGYNHFGQLGDGTTTPRSTPIQIGGTNWKQVVGGYYTIAAIKTDGTLWSWGSNAYSALGQNYSIPTAISSPLQITGGGTNWKQVWCGANHTIATTGN